MKMTFRWYGEGDSIPLDYIRQIPGMTGVVTAVYDIPVGEVWPEERIARLKSLCDEHGLEMEVIESVPVHEDIKLGKPTRDRLIANYAQTIRNLGKYGVKCICYNFMPVFDWLRTNLKTVAADGSNSLSYDHEELLRLDPKNLHLPGWDESYSVDQLNGLLEEYKGITHEKLLENLKYFLDGIIPTCEEVGVRMACHPDDPAWPIFGLPRIGYNQYWFDRIMALNDSPCNSICLCTGSLGSNTENDVPAMIRHFGEMGRIGCVHIRNIKFYGERHFRESAHNSCDGDFDMFAIVKAVHDSCPDTYVRPDHGRMIWDETGRPGYGLYDRALGTQYLMGLFEAIDRMN